MTDTRTCANTACAKPLVRRPRTETPGRFAKRRSCSAPCARRAHNSPADEKPCQQCGTTMRRDPKTMGPKEWRERKRYCSPRCLTLSQTAPPAEPVAVSRAMNPDATRTCIQCGGLFKRRIGTESTVKFAARECCSRPCAQARKAELRSEVGPGVVLPDSKQCELCSAEFSRPASDGPKRWLGRRFCGPICAGQAKRKPKPERSAKRSRQPKRNPRNAQTSIPVPAAPAPSTTTVWRPASWGGSITIPAAAAPAPVVEVLNAAV